MIPVWLLDIDGVINAYGGGVRVPSHAWPKEQWIITTVKGLHIWAAKPVLDFIRGVHEWKDAEIRWHTTWQQHALELGDVLGLPVFPVQDAPEYAFFTEDAEGWWKLPAVHRVMKDEGRSVIWTDDDAVLLSTKQRGELQDLGAIEIIAPSSQTGLCKRHLRSISNFLEAGP